MATTRNAIEQVVLIRVLRMNATVYGLVTGIVAGLALFIATNWLVLKGGEVVGPHLGLLGQYFIGYRVTFAGSFIGFGYAFALGFAVAWAVATLYNTFLDWHQPLGKPPAPTARINAERRQLRALPIALGVILTAIGVALPPAAIVHVLRPDVTGSETLEWGARMFTYILVVFGSYLVAVAGMRPAPPSASTVALRSDGPGVWITLGAIVVVAAALRFHALDAGLWYDEILMYVQYADKSVGEIVTTYDSQNQHFLYTILVRVAISVFGDTAWALRLPAVLFGVAGVVALYLFARTFVTAREALLSAALLAVSYHHVWFSQNARGYTALLFWTLLSSWSLCQALRSGRRRHWVLYAVGAALGVYTHLTMIFVIAAQAVVYVSALWTRRREAWPTRWDGARLGWPLTALLILQLHALVIPQVLAGVVDEASPVAVWRHPLWTVLELFQGAQIGFSGWTIAVVVLVVFAAGLLSLARTAPAVVTLFLVPVGVCGIVVVGSGHHLWPRFFFFALGFAVVVVVRGTIVVTHGVARALGADDRRAAATGPVAAVVLLGAAAVALPTAYAPKQDYLGALTFIEAHRAPEDAVVTVGLATFPYRRFYKVDWQSVDSVESLQRLRAQSRRTWVVYTLPLHLEAVRPDLMATIRRDFRTVRTFAGTLSGGTIVVARTDGAPPAPRGGLWPPMDEATAVGYQR